MEEPKASDFTASLREKAHVYGIRLSDENQKRLTDYYRMVMAWNARLHLVAPCSPAEFATRHVLESLVALAFLPEGARVADVGSGAGLPIIPCLIVRTDLQATLFEASSKKTVFLREALRLIEEPARAKVIAGRFEEAPRPEAGFVTCRALDRFREMFEKLVGWSPPSSTLLFFGGPSLQEEIEREGLKFRAILIPETERRFIFVIERRAED